MLPESDEEKALKLTRSSEERGEFCMDWKLAKGMDHKNDFQQENMLGENGMRLLN